jgi:hypothetical protein
MTDMTMFGPYPIVVGADGVNSMIRQQALCATYLIGDARWARDRWYDMGLRRIRRGAELAMNDGMELGRLIVRGEGGDWIDEEDANQMHCHHRHHLWQRRSIAHAASLSEDCVDVELYAAAVAMFAVYHSFISRYLW